MMLRRTATLAALVVLSASASISAGKTDCTGGHNRYAITFRSSHITSGRAFVLEINTPREDDKGRVRRAGYGRLDLGGGAGLSVPFEKGVKSRCKKGVSLYRARGRRNRGSFVAKIQNDRLIRVTVRLRKMGGVPVDRKSFNLTEHDAIRFERID